MKRLILAISIAGLLLPPIAARAHSGYYNGWYGWHGHHHGCTTCWAVPLALGLGVLGGLAAPHYYAPPPVNPYGYGYPAYIPPPAVYYYRPYP